MQTFVWIHVAALLFLVGRSSGTAHSEKRCTAMVVGAKASTTGTPMTTQTDDCASCDFRIAKVPAMKYKSGALRDVVLPGFDYPRYVGDQRGDVFRKDQLDNRFFPWPATPSIGKIPEANETYGYIDGTYAIMNEQQLAFGESTCSGIFFTKPKSQGGEALLDISELSRIALQRCKTARCAVQLMGDLGVKYGYYGAEWYNDYVGYGEAGEAITATDPKEAWVFHILPDDTGKSAIWVAQRVPDDHIVAIANEFVIREIDLNDRDNFLGSDNIYEVAKRNGLWRSEKQDGPLNFARVYSKPDLPVNWKYYWRRVWRVFMLANPSLDLPPNSDGYGSEYPFSVKPAKKLSPHDLMRIQRDHYEGTPFDLTKGPSAGPFGDPDRYESAPNSDMSQDDIDMGSFERAISIYRTTYSYVTVLHPKDPNQAYIWYGSYSPQATVYSPIYAQVTSVPTPFSNGSLLSYDSSISFWAHLAVGNWAARFYKFAHPFVEKLQLQLEQEAEDAQSSVLSHAVALLKSDGVDFMREYLTKQSAAFADKEVRASQDLFHMLVTTFHDGYQFTNLTKATMTVTNLFYPKWWLQQVGYFAPSKALRTQTLTESSPDSSSSVAGEVFTTLLVSWVSLVVGIFVGKRLARPAPYSKF